MATLLNAKAFFGIEEFYRLATDETPEVMNAKRTVVADLINAASEAIEQFTQGPIITRQFQEYYYGQGGMIAGEIGPGRLIQEIHLASGARLILEHRPLVIDGSHALLVRVRDTGDELDQTASGWVTWTENTEFIVNKDKGLLTVNPAKKSVWPAGFRNIYISYYAGYGDQTKDAQSEVIGSTVPDDIKFAGKKLVEHWFKRGIVEWGNQFMELQPDPRFQRNMNDLMDWPDITKSLLKPYVNRRPPIWGLR